MKFFFFLVLLVLPTTISAAEDFTVQDVWLFNSERGYAVQADLTIKKTEKLRDLLHGGFDVCLKFELNFIQERNWWPDKTLVNIVWAPKISYDSLLARYTFTSGKNRYEYRLLEEALKRAGQLRAAPDDVMERLAKAEKVYVSALFELDIENMPQPIQVDLLTDDEWEISSGWKRFPIKIRS